MSRETLQPFGMLIEHRIHDVDERFVTREKAVTPGKQITFEPTLAHVLAEHFNDPAASRLVLIRGQDRLHKNLVGDFIQRIQPVGSGLVRTEHAEVLGFQVQLHHVAQEGPRKS